MISWMIGQAGLTALRAANSVLAQQYFDQPTSYVTGQPPVGWATNRVYVYTSYADYVGADIGHGRWVLYDNEKWDATPVTEQQHPTAYIDAFTLLAHSRTMRHRAIIGPARDLMAVDGADYTTATKGEPTDQAFLSSGIPASASNAEVFHVQAQADQATPSAYQALVQGCARQLPANHLVWTGLTTLRGDSVANMVACYKSVTASGFWLNTNSATINIAVQFLEAIKT